ncbi:WG repeat-containing protein [Campylobacter coli]
MWDLEGLQSWLNGKYGFIDKSGEFVIEPIFDDIRY